MVLILFCLPWVDISCDNKKIATQNAYQAMLGDISPANNTAGDSVDTESMSGLNHMALILIIATLCILSGLVASLLKNTGGSVLTAAGGFLIFIQIFMGFPLSNYYKQQIKEEEARIELLRPTISEDSYNTRKLTVAMLTAKITPVAYATGLLCFLPLLGPPTLKKLRPPCMLESMLGGPQSIINSLL